MDWVASTVNVFEVHNSNTCTYVQNFVTRNDWEIFCEDNWKTVILCILYQLLLTFNLKQTPTASIFLSSTTFLKFCLFQIAATAIHKKHRVASKRKWKQFGERWRGRSASLLEVLKWWQKLPRNGHHFYCQKVYVTIQCDIFVVKYWYLLLASLFKLKRFFFS